VRARRRVGGERREVEDQPQDTTTEEEKVMAKKSEQGVESVENVENVEVEAKERATAETRENLVVTLSERTLGSIGRAAEKLEQFGINAKTARSIVRAEIERLAAEVDAVDLFEAEFTKKFAEIRSKQ